MYEVLYTSVPNMSGIYEDENICILEKVLIVDIGKLFDSYI